MRIIGGFARSLPLTAPRSGTRPTSDRVREALFGALDARDAVDGARVLDLYAGSGALALEAISRGAASAVLVERNAAAAGVARRNADRVLASGPPDLDVRVVTQAVTAFLGGTSGPFDLVFADPPYDLTDEEMHRVLQLVAPRVSEDGYVLVERSSRSADLREPDGLLHAGARTYGETTVWWFERAPGQN